MQRIATRKCINKKVVLIMIFNVRNKKIPLSPKKKIMG
jgi:hypothetical protein